jgi:hypothetical protein
VGTCKPFAWKTPTSCKISLKSLQLKNAKLLQPPSVHVDDLNPILSTATSSGSRRIKFAARLDSLRVTSGILRALHQCRLPFIIIACLAGWLVLSADNVKGSFASIALNVSPQGTGKSVRRRLTGKTSSETKHNIMLRIRGGCQKCLDRTGNRSTAYFMWARSFSGRI